MIICKIVVIELQANKVELQPNDICIPIFQIGAHENARET